MKNKFFRTFAVTLAAVLCLTAFSTTAFAGGADPEMCIRDRCGATR